MTSPDDIAALRDQTLAELASAHDYFVDTKSAWGMVIRLIERGESITIWNQTTGTVTHRSQLALKANGYVTEQLTEATFQQFLSIFEHFYFDLLRLWLTAYPQSLGKKTLEFRKILEMPDKDSVTD